MHGLMREGRVKPVLYSTLGAGLQEQASNHLKLHG